MVELRVSTHLHSQMHYIRTIKDGSVKIMMNVNAKGKLKLKWRDLVDVYNQENIKDDESIPGIQERVLMDVGDVSDKTQGSCLPGAEVNIEAESEDFSMTLDKIRKQCREKKRKRRIHRDTESVSEVKVEQECLPLQTEDEGREPEEPLSCWDTKFSKRRKRKEERKTKRSSTSPSMEKVGLPVFCDVKTEPLEDSSEAMDNIPMGPLLDCNKETESPTNVDVMEEIMNDSSEDRRLVLYCSEEPNSPEMVAIEEPRTIESPTNTESVEDVMKDSSEDTRLVLYFSEEPNSLEMVAIEEPRTTELAEKAFTDASEEFNDASEEFIDAPVEFTDVPEEFNDARDVQCCLADNIALENQENVFYGSVSMEESEFEVPQDSESEILCCVPISSNKSSDSEEVKEDDVESNVSEPNFDMTITGWEMVKIEEPEILPIDYSVAPTMDFGEENSEIVWETEDTAKDDLPEATVFLQLTNGCDSVPDDSKISLVEEEEDQMPERLQQQPASSEHVDEAGDQKSSQVYKAPDEVTTDVETKSIQQEKLHNQPEKLLSGRKTLSPNSQAKLRKAMEQPSSPEKKIKKPRVKLYFSSQASQRILKAEGLETINRVEVIPNSKQAIQKANNNTRQTQAQNQRATNKLPRRDIQATKSVPFSSGCASLQGCTQKAISFSQGQMRDFQFVAARLTKELKSMRQITKRCLLAESNASNLSDSNLDEMKLLIGNAEKTEESSKKWLSMIERDCNRFCKLMGMVTEDSPATENIVQKKRKIRFADDAGGDLCQVKVFEIDLESET